MFECIAICSKETAKDSWPEFEVLYELLNKLESLQQPRLSKYKRKTSMHLLFVYLGRSDNENRLEKVGAFVQWLDGNHVDHSSVKLTKISEGVGLGLHAAHVIKVFVCFIYFTKVICIYSKVKSLSQYH